MCQSKEEGGARCQYSIRKSKLRNASARLRTVLKKLEAGELSSEEHIELISARDNILTEQYELYSEAGESSLPDGWERHLTEDLTTDLHHVKGLIAEGDLEGLGDFVDDRVVSEEFVTALNTRDLLIQRKEDLTAEYKALEAEYNENGGDFEVVRQAALSTLENNEELAMVRNELDEYRAITAQAVAAMSTLREESQRKDGTYVEYDSEQLGDLVSIGEFVSGSREWLESRQGGVGGSDIGALMRTDPEYGYKNYQEVLASKVEPISDEQVAEQGNNMEEFNNAAARGNAWEEEILHRFSEKNPDIAIAHCKTSWKNAELPFQHANFDGLMLNENGVPDGIIEIKTGSNVQQWGNPEDGIDGIPDGYRAQVLWYMQAAKLKRGALAVVLNDSEYREYHWNITPELEEEQARNMAAAKVFWAEVEDRKANPHRYLPKRRAGGFTAASLAPGYRNKESAFRDLAAYREQSEGAIRERFDLLVPREEDRKDPVKVAEALETMYTEYNPASRTRPIVGIDLETNSTSPVNGRILEVGMTVRNPDGTEIKKVQQLHGLSDRARRGHGAGATEVHNINLSDVLGKPRFESERNQKRVLADLKNSGVVLAHNANYEDRWLRVHLKGYAEARDAGEIRLLDTMVLSRNLIPDAKNHTLKSFVEHNGGEYSGAHRAYRDAEIMTDAFFKFQDELKTRI